MAVFLSPIGNDQQLDANGNPLNGGQIFVYLAGSTTPVDTYTSATGLVKQSQPIILNTLGLPNNPIWITGGAPVKFEFKTAAGVVFRPQVDNVSGINDTSLSFSEWISSSLTPTYINDNSFFLAGDQTSTFQVGRRIRTQNTSGLVYSTITACVFGAVTTVTLFNDNATVLDAGLSKIEYGLLTATNTSVPNSTLPACSVYQPVGQFISITGKLLFSIKDYDTDNKFDSLLSRFKPDIAGYFHINSAAYFTTSLNPGSVISIYKNGLEFKRGVYTSSSFGFIVSADVFLSATDYVEILVFIGVGTNGITVPGISTTYFQAHAIRRAN